MKSFAVAAALVGAVAAMPQPAAVTSAISPKSSAPAGCSDSHSEFEIQVVNVTSSSKRSAEKRSTALMITLANGVLTDAEGRTGYIASNNQFQFDGPPQAGAIYTSGWSVCSNGTLALGSETTFYQCLSGTFYNLYDENDSAQCSEVYIDVLGGDSTGGAGVSSAMDGQATAAAASGAASQISDGQITASAVASPVTQITDGQIQATTGTPVSQISDGQIQATTGAAVSQISDGQIQATTAAAPVTQISDGQIQATTGAAVSQISDGQIQATTGAPVSQISDGQIQATTGVAVSQISDGQIQATTNGTAVMTAMPTTTSAAVFTGAAAFPTLRSELFGLAAGVLAVAVL